MCIGSDEEPLKLVNARPFADIGVGSAANEYRGGSAGGNW
jgi:hypothetical protein